MKHIITTISLVAFIFIANGQNFDHIQYKQDFDPVYSLALDSAQYRKALKQWDKVEKKYPSLHTEEHLLRAFCYYKLGKSNKAAKAVRSAWCHFTDDPRYLFQLKNFKISEMVESFSEKQMKWVNEGYEFNKRIASFDYDSINYLIESLNNSDQRFRALIDQSNANLSEDSLSNLRVKQDSLDMLEFIRIYNKYGYPGEKVSFWFSDHSMVFLLHSADYDWFYTKMYPMFEKDVRNGEMPASLFLMWIDRHSISKGQQPEFAMYGNPNRFQATPEEIEQIKKKRLEYGVSTLFAVPFEIK